MMLGVLLVTASARNLFLLPAGQPGAQKPVVQPALQPRAAHVPSGALSQPPTFWYPAPVARPWRAPAPLASAAARPSDREPSTAPASAPEPSFLVSVGFVAAACGLWAAFVLLLMPRSEGAAGRVTRASAAGAEPVRSDAEAA